MNFCLNCSSDIPDDDHHIGAPVKLKIYDVVQTWSVVDFFGLGLYHTTVEVYDKEFVFGCCDSSTDGIKFYPAGFLDSLELPYRFRESTIIGYTMYSEAQVDEIIQYLQKHYTGDSYDIILHNCNHFTQDFVKMLCNRDIPKYVNRLASIISSNNFLQRLARSICESNESIIHNM